MTTRVATDDIPVALWTPEGCQGPMAFDLSSDEGIRGLREQVDLEMDSYRHSTGQGWATDPNLGGIKVVVMPRKQLEGMPEHPGW